MKFSEALELFLESKTAEGLSQETVRWYRRRLGRLAEFLGDTAANDVQITELRRFIISIRNAERKWETHPYRNTIDGGLAPATLNGYVRAIKRLFNWFDGEGLIESNPTLRLKLPPLPKQPPKGIEQDDLLAMLHATEGDHPGERRDRALLLFLAETGCRVAGLVGLRKGDVDMDAGTALVTEKGSKARYVFFSEPTKDALTAWLNVAPTGSTWLFPNLRSGEQLQTTGINQILGRIRDKAGVDGRTNPHAFRHAFAKQYLMNGGDLATLSDLMGHTDVTVTKNFYSVFRIDELREKHHRHSPIRDLDLSPIPSAT